MNSSAKRQILNHLKKQGKNITDSLKKCWINTLYPNCPDCGVGIGEVHDPGCDVERYSVCGRQWISCGHAGHDPLLSKWTGAWPKTER